MLTFAFYLTRKDESPIFADACTMRISQLGEIMKKMLMKKEYISNLSRMSQEPEFHAYIDDDERILDLRVCVRTRFDTSILDTVVNVIYKGDEFRQMLADKGWFPISDIVLVPNAFGAAFHEFCVLSKGVDLRERIASAVKEVGDERVRFLSDWPIPGDTFTSFAAFGIRDEIERVVSKATDTDIFSARPIHSVEYDSDGHRRYEYF